MARNLIADPGMVQVNNPAYWDIHAGISASMLGTRIVSLSAFGDPAGQLRRIIGPWDLDTTDENRAGRFIVARVRAFTDSEDSLGNYEPAGPPAKFGITLRDHPTNAHGIAVDIPFGTLNPTPERPGWHDLEVIHEVAPEDAGYRVVWKIEVGRGDRGVYVEAPSAELYIVDDLAELGGGGAPPRHRRHPSMTTRPTRHPTSRSPTPNSRRSP